MPRLLNFVFLSSRMAGAIASLARQPQQTDWKDLHLDPKAVSAELTLVVVVRWSL